VLTGGASGDGASCPHPAADNTGKANNSPAIPNRRRILVI